jgi:hypothetical protein
MQLRADGHVPFERDLVFVTYRDRLAELVEFMPNVRRIEVVSREDKGGVVEIVNVWHGGGEIPAAARVVLSESMLSWTEYATWDETTHTCSWRIETHSFKGAVRCRGTNRFLVNGAETHIEIRGDLEIDTTRIRAVPRFLSKSVGQTVTEFLVKKIAPNLVVASEGLTRYLERHHKK